MEPERWQQVKQIVGVCFELDAEQREAHIATACANDPTMAAEVNSLLASYAEVGDFMASPALGEPPGELPAGTQIGSYQIREAIAEGGMGTVYLAVRASDFEKQVAIKLVKRGMDTNFILRRFRHERQILAGLDHPNIARLLDGGATQDGRPYLVMEYIDGTPITEYVEEHQLGIPERLEMFRTVCAAVQCAHQNLVVHRDLKPSNILVTSKGVPKLLDFGIAKLLEPDADATATSLRLMTPECASPEQVRGEPVTTATDIYSLGVLLYHLLTVESPYEFTTRTPEEITRVICETEPKKPSAIRPLSEDLDTIVLKAMHKDPKHRYQSAEQLSEDIRRFLGGLPVLARKDTFRYRASKFVKRHKAASIAAALVTVSLLAGLAATLWEGHIAGLERARAERRFNDVRELANSLIFELHDNIKDLPGSTPARKLLIDRALKYLNRLAQDAGGDTGLQNELALAYLNVGDVQGGPRFSNLGDSDGALVSYRKALQTFQARAAAEPSSLDFQRRVAECFDRIGSLQLVMGKTADALKSERGALAANEKISKDRAATWKDFFRLSQNYEIIGDLLGGVGDTGNLADPAGALENHRKSLDIDREILKRDAANVTVKDGAAVDEVTIGADLMKLGRRPEALEQYGLAVVWWSHSPNAAQPRTRQKLATVYSWTGDALLMDGEFQKALANYQAEFDIFKSMLQADPRNARFQLGMADSYASLGAVFARTGKPVEGRASLDKAIEIIRQQPAKHGRENTVVAQFLMWKGSISQIEKNWNDALKSYRAAQDLYKSVADAEPTDVNARINEAASMSTVAGVLKEQGKAAEARDAYHRALEMLEAIAKTSSSSLAARYALADAYSGLGDLEAAASSWSAARSWYEQSLSAWEQVHNPGIMSPTGFFTDGPKAVRAKLTQVQHHGT